MRPAIPALIVTALLAAPVFAKLPPPSDEAKAKAAEAAAKSGWTDKVAAYKLCRAMDHVTEVYRRNAKAAGKEAPAPVETPPCTDPGPFTPPPLEASGAHSPPATATAPPSSNATAAQQQGQPKK
jgi:hypothetical protein